MRNRYTIFPRLSILILFVLTLIVQPQSSASALTILTVTPITWNVIGLDSNNVSVGPNQFPIGARVCNTGTESATNVTAVYNWDSTNTYINIRPNTLSSVNLGTLTAGTCADAYFEVEVTRNSSAYNTTRNYHIDVTAGNVTGTTSTLVRQLYVERLVSQSRNTTSNVEYGTSLGSMTSVAAGGTMNLMVGNTYYIRVTGSTATNGYEQLESFLNIPNVIFQTLSVSTDYSADSSATVSDPNDKLYGDACVWENDHTNPNYRSCLSTGKVGGNITITYQVKILQVPSSPLLNPQPLSSLVYDFSGSSYHYNADFDVSTRYANIVNASITKSFAPKTITPGGTSTLTFRITNPGADSLTNVNFIDNLPSGVTISSTSITYTSCGSPSPSSLTIGQSNLSFSNITVAGLGTCIIAVSVTSSTSNTYNNTSQNLFINSSIDTGSFATDTLIVSSAPTPPSSCTPASTMVTWTMPNAGQGSGGPPPPYTTKASDVSTATTAAGLTGAGASTIDTVTGNSVNSWRIQDNYSTGTSAPGVGSGIPYFEFTVDSSNYGGVSIDFDYNMLANNNWGGTNAYHLYSSADSGAYTLVSSTSATKNGWQSSIVHAATATGSGTTTFRLTFTSRNPSQGTANVYLDNINITGCPRPTVPTLSKAFSPTSIAQTTGTSALTFTFSNPNTIALSAISFSDTLPTGLVISTPNGLSAISCSAGSVITSPTITASQATTLISMTGLQLAANSTCSFSVNVSGTTAGAYTNTSGTITSTSTGPNTTSTGYGVSNLTVVAPPVIQKTFTANPIFTGNSTTLNFSIYNPNSTTTLTGISFTDNLPAGLIVAGTPSLTNTCGGTATAVAASSTVSLTGASLTAGSTCTITVSVTGSTVGLKNNSVTVSSTNGGTGNTDTASVLVKDPVRTISALKSVSASSSGPWSPSLTVTLPGSVYYRFIVENTGDITLSNVNINDPNVDTSTCTWVDGSGATISTSGANFSLPVSNVSDTHFATCVIGPITAAVGVNPNTVTADDNNPGTANTSATSSATYTGIQPNLTISKTDNDADNTVLPGVPFDWTITVTNDGNATANFANTQVIMSDALPGVDAYYTLGSITEVNGTPAPTGTIDCAIVAGPTLSCVANGAVTLPPNASFNLTFTVTPTITGTLANTAIVDPNNVVTESNETAANNQSTNTITVAQANLTISKTDNDADNIVSLPGATFDWTITVTNDGNATANFANTQVIMSDALPGVDTYYTLGSITEVNGTPAPTGTIDCAIVAGPTLSCVANGAVTLPANASFSLTFTVTPTSAGTLANTAIVDPNNVVTESNETAANNQSTNSITAQSTTLTIVKQVVNDDGGTAVVGAFGINTNAGTLTFGAGVTVVDTTTYTATTLTVSPGTYTLREDDIVGYTEGTWNCTDGTLNNNSINLGSITLADGDATTCTITNNDQQGSIQLVKVVTNDNGGTATNANFPFTDNIPGTLGTAVVTGSAPTLTYTYPAVSVDAGAYTFSEGDVAGYTEGTWSCTGATASGTAYNAGGVSVPNGGTVVCTITNNDQQGSIQLVKVVTNDNGGTATNTNFPFTDNIPGTLGTAVVTGSAPTLTYSYPAVSVDAGAYTFSEGDVAGYTEGTWSCTGATASGTAYNAGGVSVPNGGTVVCTITNNDDSIANLSITKTDGLSSVTAGTSTSYTIIIANAGPSAADNAIFTDPVATGLSVTSITCGSALGGATCPTVANTTIALMQGTGIIIPTLPSGGSVTFTVVATVTISSGSVTNIANIDPPSGTTDSDPTNNSATDTDTVNPVPAPALNILKVGTLDLTVVLPNSQANAGDEINYTITVQNTGNQNLTGVSVTDSMLDASGNNTLDCDSGILGNQTTGLSISIGNSLICTGSYTLTQADLNNNGGGDGDIDNTATADSIETPPDTVDEDVPLPLSPSIQVDKTLSSSTFTNPNTLRVTYLIDVINTGNVRLTNIQLTDDLVAAFPGAVSFSVFTHFSSGTTTLTRNNAFNGVADQNLLTGVDTLEVGQSGQITLIVDVDTGGDEDNYINLAIGTGITPTASTVRDDGRASAPSFVDPAIAKVANVAQASVGDVVVFTITVTNNGNLPAPDVVVVDLLPAMFDVTNVSVVGGPAGTITTISPPIGGAAPFVVTVQIGGAPGVGNNPLGVGDVVVITVTTVVNSLGAPPIVNNASLTTSAITDNPRNNAAAVPLNILSPSTGGTVPALPKTGFAPHKITNLPIQPDDLAYTSTDVMLEIPSLNLKMPIVGVPLTKNGWDVTWLANQAGWLEGSAFPSFNGNSVLTSHVTLANGLAGPFANLGKLKYGDQFIIHANGQTFIYELRSNTTIAADNKTYFKHEELPWLTLITCKEYDEKTGTYKKRIIVRAVLIEVK